MSELSQKFKATGKVGRLYWIHPSPSLSMLTGFFPGVWAWACWRAEDTQRIHPWFSRGGCHSLPVHCALSAICAHPHDSERNEWLRLPKESAVLAWLPGYSSGLGDATLHHAAFLRFHREPSPPRQHLCQGRGRQREKITSVSKPEPTISL